MLIDALIGSFSVWLGLVFGCSNNSFFLIIVAYILDVDIVISEAIRYIKKEKKLSPYNLLDEFSYQHKRIFHHLVPVIIGAIVAWLLVNWIFGLLCFSAMICHLIHDFADAEFCGIRWLYPFNRYYYKWRKINGKWVVIKKTTEQLLAEAARRNNNPKTKRTIKQLIRAIIIQ